MYDYMKNKVHGTYKGVAEKVLPVLTESQFDEKGVLTPEEFVTAGDQLTYKCPTWSWHAGDRTPWEYLPEDKQFLITRNVPCPKRCAEVQDDLVEEQVEATGDDEGWCNTMSKAALAETNNSSQVMGNADDDIPTMDISVNSEAKPVAEEIPTMEEINKKDPATTEPKNSDSNIPNMDDFEDNGILDEDEDGVDDFEEFQNETFERTRTYDLSISYDKYYQVPHVWLRGYDPYSNPLSNEQILEDISSDHAHKTATVENHPHLRNVVCVSIHPCKHAEVMKAIIDRMKSNGQETVRVDQYIFLFLKFLSAVIPTIQYDHTNDVRG